jgi:Tfp pilus assembly protein PilX
MIRRLGRVRRDDRGAALLLALIIITVMAVGVSVLLTFVDTNLRTTVHLREQAATTYGADGALKAAVNDLGTSGRDPYAGENCLPTGDVWKLPAQFSGADTATVKCVLDADPDQSQVRIQCPSLSNCNRPGSAILTLGKVAGEDGINITQPTGSVFRVHGGIFSNSNINVVNGSLNTDTWVYAREACAGIITSTPPASCNNGSTSNPFGNDPGYLPDVTAVPVHRALPACTTARSVVTFEPGYYDDAVGLTAMMDGNSACRKSTWWFKPGTYYFDFHNSGTNRNPLLPNGSNVWTLDDRDGSIVAGTPVDSSGAAVAAPSVPAVVPGACDNPIHNAEAKGVQFIFGGDSRFAVKTGQVEICGTYSATKPPVAVYGVPTGAETPTALTGADNLRLTAVPSTGAFGASATPATLATVDGTPYASWMASRNNDTGSVTVSGFAPPQPIPAGSILTGATVRVTHRHGTASDRDALSVTLTPNGGTTSVTGTSPGRLGSTAMVTDTIALDTAATGVLARSVYAGTFTGATIGLTVTLPTRNDTEDLDAIQLDLTYVPPAMRGASGCVTTTPYTGGGSTGAACALITTINNAGNQFYVQGTTYAPKGAVDLTLNNAAEQVFRFGVIARALWTKLTGSFSYTGVVIEVPDDSPGFGFAIYLYAYVCPPGATTCDPDATADLWAKVAFVDVGPAQREVTVLSWSRPSG